MHAVITKCIVLYHIKIHIIVEFKAKAFYDSNLCRHEPTENRGDRLGTIFQNGL